MKASPIAEMRAFNRFYTGIIGVLNEHILDSKFSLPEVRILYELYHNGAMSASDIITLLHIDKGYLSRLLKEFEKKKLVHRKQSKEDARSYVVELTSTGKKEFEGLNKVAEIEAEVARRALSARRAVLVAARRAAGAGAAAALSLRDGFRLAAAGAEQRQNVRVSVEGRGCTLKRGLAGAGRGGGELR